MRIREEDKQRMAECIELARRGEGQVSPNPLVGAVIEKGGRIIGKGYHRRFGGPHAEIHAMRNAAAKLNGTTLYVNLEPCCHHGKTPPCTDAILSKGIRRVVVGMEDPNPLVKGKGIRALRSAGIQVAVGVLREECEKLNEFYMQKMRTGLPFVAIKVAQTLDGKISHGNGHPRWITSMDSRRLVHRLRAEYDAVLIGAGTAIADNPRLTARLSGGRSPTRIILDGNLRTPLSSRVFTDSHRYQTVVFTRGKGNHELNRKRVSLRDRGVLVREMKTDRTGRIDLRMVLREIGSMGINSLLVEGGQQVFTQFLGKRLVNKIYVFIAPKVYGDGGLSAFAGLSGRARLFQNSSFEVKRVGPDLLVEGYLSTRS